MVVPTAVRPGRSVALFAAVQSAKGTPVSDFTAAGAKRLWTHTGDAWVGPEPMPRRFMTSEKGPGTLWMGPDKPEGELVVKGTPKSLQWLLESNYGALSDGTFALATGIAGGRWLTLAEIEDRFDGGASADRIVRIQDAWVHRLDLVWDWSAEVRSLEAVAAYHGRKVLIQQQDAGGITYPAAPMQPADQDPFPVAKTTLIRDPDCDNVEYRFRRVTVDLYQGLGSRWDMGSGMWSVWKAGPLRARISIEDDWSDETWALVDLARAGTKSVFRVRSVSDAGSDGGKVLTLTLHGVVLKVDSPGHAGQEYLGFSASGEATVVGSSFVDISMADAVFLPAGPTVKLVADATAPTGLQVGTTQSHYRIYNEGDETVWLAFGATAAAAQTNAVIPTGGGANAKDAFPLPPGAIEVVSAPAGSFWSGITEVGSADVYITPGHGL